MEHFKNVIGYEGLKRDLEIIIDMLNNKSKYMALGVEKEHAIMLSGRPGVGKTTIASSFIDALENRTKIVLRKTKDGDEFIDEINDVFKRAKDNAPSVILFDDLDKFANNDMDHQDAPEYVVIQTGIDELKNSDVFVIATANDLELLPSSLLRAGRLRNIEVDIPKGKDARDIIYYYISKKKFSSDVDPLEIVRLTEGSTCAQIENLVNQACIYAGFENREMASRDDLIKAYLRLVQGIPEVIDYENKEILERIAVHEAGHATIGEVLESGSIDLISVKRCNSEIGGITCFYQYDDYFIEKKHMENRVISLLGGRAATEVYYGLIDVGCESDLEQAYNIVSSFISSLALYGFDKASYGMFSPSSDAFNRRKENYIHLELERYYQEAKRLLVSNKNLFTKIKDELINKKVLCANDIQSIKNSLSLLDEPKASTLLVRA